MAKARHLWEKAGPWLKRARSSRNAPCLRDLSGTLRSAAEASNVRAEYLSKSLWASPPPDGSPEAPPPIPPEMLEIVMAPLNNDLARPFDRADIRRVVERARRNTSDRPYRVCYEVWQALLESSMLDRLVDLMNAGLQTGEVPAAFDLEHIWALFKKKDARSTGGSVF